MSFGISEWSWNTLLQCLLNNWPKNIWLNIEKIFLIIRKQKVKPKKQMDYYVQFWQKNNGNWFWLGHKIVWSYQTTYKITTNHTPFQLVYGQEVILLIELELLSLWITLNEKLSLNDSLMGLYTNGNFGFCNYHL
jgi:hypothetical protein